MINLERLADNDLLLHGFSEFLHDWCCRVMDHDLDDRRGINYDTALSIPEELKIFYDLRARYPEIRLGACWDVGELRESKDGYVWFCELSGNCQLGVKELSTGKFTLARYAAEPDEWTDLPEIRIDHLLVEMGLRSLSYVQPCLKYQTTASGDEWYDLLNHSREMWTGKFTKDQKLFCFDYDESNVWLHESGFLLFEQNSKIDINGTEYDAWMRAASFIDGKTKAGFELGSNWTQKDFTVNPKASFPLL